MASYAQLERKLNRHTQSDQTIAKQSELNKYQTSYKYIHKKSQYSR